MVKPHSGNSCLITIPTNCVTDSLYPEDPKFRKGDPKRSDNLFFLSFRTRENLFFCAMWIFYEPKNSHFAQHCAIYLSSSWKMVTTIHCLLVAFQWNFCGKRNNNRKKKNVLTDLRRRSNFSISLHEFFLSLSSFL